MQRKLTINDHSRDIAGLKYVYPVISRRAGGLSIGINFNTNNACNWRCVYCQVPELKSGAAPELELSVLESELKFLLQDVLHGDFYDRYGVEPEQRSIKDIAISGNGEPTSLRNFANAVTLIGEIRENYLSGASDFVLITNGSLMHKKEVKKGLEQLQQFQGQTWIKCDAATPESLKMINQAGSSWYKQKENIITAAGLCQTWLQTCVMQIDGNNSIQQQADAYMQLLKEVIAQVEILGIMLYSLARPSLQPEAHRLSRVEQKEMNVLADKIRCLGLTVHVFG